MLAALLTEQGDPNKAFARPVKDVMVTRLETISADAPIADLVPLFRKRSTIAIVLTATKFVGARLTALDLHQLFARVRTR